MDEPEPHKLWSTLRNRHCRTFRIRRDWVPPALLARLVMRDSAAAGNLPSPDGEARVIIFWSRPGTHRDSPMFWQKLP